MYITRCVHILLHIFIRVYIYIYILFFVYVAYSPVVIKVIRLLGLRGECVEINEMCILLDCVMIGPYDSNA